MTITRSSWAITLVAALVALLEIARAAAEPSTHTILSAGIVVVLALALIVAQATIRNLAATIELLESQLDAHHAYRASARRARVIGSDGGQG